MTTEAAPKPWQHGYALDHLKAIEALYGDYNRHSVSPFSAVKKHSIAEMLHTQRLRVFYGSDNTPSAALSVTRSKVKSAITIYNNVVLADKLPNDVTLAHFAGDQSVLATDLADYIADDTWAYVWSADVATQTLLSDHGFRRMGSKVSTFGEIIFVYFRDSDRAYEPGTLFGPRGARGTNGIPDEELVGIKRIGHVGSPALMHIARELAQSDLAFTNHYSNYNKGDSWSAVALRGFSADPAFIAKPLEMNKKWKAEHKDDVFALQDTPLRAQFPDVTELLRPYGDDFERIRFMKLAPGGGELERHTDQVDPETGVRVGNNARIHIPIVTNEKVEFTSWDLDDVPHVVNMRVGEVWYLDTRKPHRAINGGDSARVHLVVDVIVTPRFQDLVSGRA